MVPTDASTYQHGSVPVTPVRVQVRCWAPPVAEMPSTRVVLEKSVPEVITWNSCSHSVHG